MDRDDYLIKELSTEIKVLESRARLIEEASFWLSIAKIYLDTKTMNGISECNSICECVEKMRLK